MSWETQSWAAKQRPGSASAKLVLLGLASCADAHHCAYPSVDWLCEFGDLNRKTVIAALQRLEEGLCPLIEDTGERRGRTKQVKVYRLRADDKARDVGAQTHYVYRLVHTETGQYYIGVRSVIGDPLHDSYMGSGNWPVAMRAAGVTLEKHIVAVKDSRDDADIAEALAIKASIGDRLCMNIEYKDTGKGIPNLGLLNDAENGTLGEDKSPDFTPKQSQNRDTEPFREPLPPSDPNGSDSPQGHEQGGGEQEDRNEQAPAGDQPAEVKADRSRGTRLPRDWTPPPVDDLPPQAQALARQWPDGAYETEAEAFVGYWANLPGGKARKLDWVATWANRIVAINAKVLRDAKAGVNFAVPSKPSVAPLPQLPVASKAAEDDRSAIMHNLLERDIGERTYARYIKPAAITFDDEGVVMIFATDFLRSYVETNLSQRIAVVLSRVAKPGEPQFLKFIVEAPANRANLEAKAA